PRRFRIEHRVVDDQLAPPFEDLAQCLPTILAFEDVVLLDKLPREISALLAELIAKAGELLFLGQVLLSSCEPLVVCRYLVGFHSLLLTRAAVPSWMLRTIGTTIRTASVPRRGYRTQRFSQEPIIIHVAFPGDAPSGPWVGMTNHQWSRLNSSASDMLFIGRVHLGKAVRSRGERRDVPATTREDHHDAVPAVRPYRRGRGPRPDDR